MDLLSMIIESRNRSRYRTAVLQDNPVAYWRLGESSGTVAADVTGNYPGTYVGSPTLGVSGAVAGNTAFRSAAGKRMERNSEVVSGVLPFTLEAWVKTSTTTNQNILVVGNSATRSAGISVAPTTGLVGAYSNGSGGTYYNIYGGFARTGEWMHVVGVFESTGIKVYLNGIESTLSQSLGSASGYTQVKCGSWLNNADPTIGDIDEAAIYSSALSINRIIAHYYAGIDGVEPFDSDALDYFTRVEAAGSTINADNKNAINQFIIGCKEDGNWTSIKASCILAGADTLSGALVPLVGTAPTNVGFLSGDYSTTGGLISNGTTKYLKSGRFGTSDPLNNQSLAVYHPRAGGSYNQTIGCGRSVNASSIGQGYIYSQTSTLTVGTTISVGLMGISRSLSGSYLYRSDRVNTPIVRDSTGRTSEEVFVFACSNGVNLNDGLTTTWPISFYSIGESINLALLDTRLAKLMNSLRPTYDVTALDYFARVEAAGSTINGNNKDAINQFIVGCKADGIWSNITQACCLAGPDTIAGAFVPLKGNTPTYTASDHTRTGGIIGPFDTQTNHTVFSKDNIHFSAWRTTASNNNHFILASGGQTTGIGTTSIEVFVIGGIGTLFTRNQCTAATNVGSNLTGFIGTSRNSSASYTRRYNNTNTNDVRTSIEPLQNANIVSQTESRLSFYSIGESIDLALLNARLATLMSSLT